MEKFNPDALCEWSSEGGSTARPGVQQDVTQGMIEGYLHQEHGMPYAVAEAVAEHICEVWFDTVDNVTITHRQFIGSVLTGWTR